MRFKHPVCNLYVDCSIGSGSLKKVLIPKKNNGYLLSISNKYLMKALARTHTKRFVTLCLLPVALLFFPACQRSEESVRDRQDLSGTWQFSMDTGNVGVTEDWHSNPLDDQLELPGTMELSQKGHPVKTHSISRLNRTYTYEGSAWYKREVVIPNSWKGQRIRLVLERTKQTMVWVDNRYVGEQLLLSAPQEYDLTNYLTPGKHTLTIRVNNDLKLTPYGNVHIYSDDTQTNWNGILGSIYLEASSMTYIKDVRVFPDVDHKRLQVKVAVANPPTDGDMTMKLGLTKRLGALKVQVMPVTFKVNADTLITLNYDMSGHMQRWDDHRQPLFDLSVTMTDNDGRFEDQVSTRFGFRSFKAIGTQFAINGRTTFLRGKNDCGIFPMTGHAPMDEESWSELFNTAKAWGINHYRFHSWCPPEAAFNAADKAGMFLQVELPFWGQLKDGKVYQQLKEEGKAILRAYGNHPSFVLFSMGNELSGDMSAATRLMHDLKRFDNRPLYTQGTNANIGYTGPVEGADFHVAARTPSSGDQPETHTRLSQAFADSREGGLLNSVPPSTNVRLTMAVAATPVPLISHEVGQYQVFPDFREIDRYTGVLKASNLAFYKRQLEKAGMMDSNERFQQASAALAALCYRAEIEAALKTPGLAGFQLLDLQDFPGQGTALVGMLNAFMESKGIIEPAAWRRFCTDVVPMLTFGKYCWTRDETFQADIEVANYSNQRIDGNLKWALGDATGKVLRSEVLRDVHLTQGAVTRAGQIRIPLSDQQEAAKLTLTVSIDSTEYSNDYPIWVFPTSTTLNTKDVFVSSLLNKAVMNQLEAGGKVLLMPTVSSLLGNSVPGMFTPDFWNYGMFKSASQANGAPVSPGTMGLLMDPAHPLFKQFPTDFHTNWQWWSLCKNSRAWNISSLDSTYRPIVQVIDNMERVNKLAMIAEFKVGKGKLLVCTARLNEMPDKPEARQLYASILNYMQSSAFQPTYNLTPEQLKRLINYTVTKR